MLLLYTRSLGSCVDTVKCGIFIMDICLGTGDLLTNSMWFSLENADTVKCV